MYTHSRMHHVYLGMYDEYRSVSLQGKSSLDSRFRRFRVKDDTAGSVGNERGLKGG